MALLTIDQAAERLGTTARFIRRLRAERRIAVVKLGKHIRIDSNDLDAFITASRQEAQAARTDVQRRLA
jgi:excisionase family DNA binding protein